MGYLQQIVLRYGYLGLVKLALDIFCTKLFYNSARIIRRPFYIRGKKKIKWGKGFTTGVGCRIEAVFLNNCSYVIKIGNNVQINDYVHIAGIEKVIISDDVLIASRVFISDHNHGVYSGSYIHSSPMEIPNDRVLNSQKVIIEKKVWIGEGVCVLQGVTIGEGSIIGANSVVNKDIPPYSIVAGIPAKVLKRYNFNTKKWEKV